MASDEGFLDYGSGRYKLIGRPGYDDYYVHAGDWLEVWRGTRWVGIQVQADVWGAWYFLDVNRSPVSVSLGMRVRLGR